MKKALLWILVLALLAVASVLGTIAYLTDEATADNVMTIGKIDIDLLEYERIDTETKDADANVHEFHDNKPLLPAVIEKGFDYTPGATYVDWTQDAVKWQQQNDDDGYTSPIWDPAKINNEVDKMVFVRNNGDYSAYVRVFFAFEAGSYTDFNDFQDKIHINLNDDEKQWKWEWEPRLAEINGETYFIAKATYQIELVPEAVTEISLSQIALDSCATNEEVDAFGNDYKVLVRTQAIQSTGFEDPETALDEGFGTDIPFDGIALVEGIDLRTALHNLNGDDSVPANKITSNVNRVIFGLNEVYPNIVSGYNGVLTSVEQETAVYTYYVPAAPRYDNKGNEIPMYDIYVLADDTIYTPANSTSLFEYMDWLISVDTTNLDVSKTNNMSFMFHQCYRLQTMDTSRWDVSNVTNMQQTFHDCNCLLELDVSGWNVSNVTTLKGTFYGCLNLAELAVKDWKVGNVTDMSFTFRGCKQFTTVAVDDWDVSKVTTFQSFISAYAGNGADQKLTTLNLSKWDTSSATNMRSMFYGCEKIVSLDLSGLDVQNVTSLNHMFSNCFGLKEIIFAGWDTSSLQDMNAMFNDCKALEAIDVSDFDTQNVTDMGQLFENCASLKEIKGLEKWQTSNVIYMYEMFYRCSELTELDLSSFDTRGVVSAFSMFAHNDIDGRLSKLTTIYVGDNWDMSSITEANADMSSQNMFTNCKVLEGGNGTTYDKNKTDKEYAIVDGKDGKPGYLTHISDKLAAPEQNQ